jgi:hypothetical protein
MACCEQPRGGGEGTDGEGCSSWRVKDNSRDDGCWKDAGGLDSCSWIAAAAGFIVRGTAEGSVRGKGLLFLFLFLLG